MIIPKPTGLNKKNKSIIDYFIWTLIILIVFAGILIIFEIENYDYDYDYKDDYTYIGKIIDMEGGSSGQLIILTLDTIGKVPYTTQRECSNNIRIGQRVYKKLNSNYLWVEYENGRYC